MKPFANLKEARKGLKLPGGEHAQIYLPDEGDFFTWSKRGGYADNVMKKLRESLLKMRWVKTDSKGYAVPDGSVMGRTDYLSKRGWTISIDASYGGIKWDNWFGITLKRSEQ